MAPDTVDRTEPQLEEGVWTTTPEGDLVPDYDATFPTINEGEVVHGTVVRVDKDEVLVDIGYKSEGVIPVSELSIRRSVNPADEVGLGDEIDALVLTKEDAEGRLILSKKRARFELAWKTIETKAETGEPIVGKVIEVVKGGLILDLGVRGFLPASLVDIRRVHDLDEFLGKELRAKVIELNRSRNNVVLSRRAVLEDERKEMRQAILDRLNPGDVVDGQISNIVDFGAFVDLDGMDGLIHISELSWRHVNHPSEVLEIGQEVKVKVLDIDRDRQRISLGLKQTQSDPWQQVVEAYGEGDVVEGRVTKVVTFGAFVEILPGVEGLVHISELAQHHVENPREVVSQGDVVNVKVIEIDADRRRLSLSLKRVEEGEAVQPRADGAPLAANLDLSEDVFGNEPRGRRAEDVEVLDEAEVAEGSLETLPEVRGAHGRSSRARAAEPVGRGAVPRRRRRPPSPWPRSREAEPVAEAEPAVEEPTPRSPSRSPRPSRWPRSLRPRSRPPRRSRGRGRGRSACRGRRARPARVACSDRSRSRSPGASAPARPRRSNAFARLGAATVSSDEIVHHLLRNDEDVKRAIVERLGEGVLDDEGGIDRSSVAEKVFADREQLAWLEALLHPLVSREYLTWREQLGRLDEPARGLP